MNWKQLISAKRFGMEEFHEERQENRSEFQRTMTVLFFRLLSADYRTRRKYSLFRAAFCTQPTYAQSRSSQRWAFTGDDVAKALLERHPELQDSFLPEIGSIVSAACLAHDLGNPPFGHSGEKAISTFSLKEKEFA